MKVARHGFDPGVGDADKGTTEIAVGEPDRLEHSARTGSVAPFGDTTTTMFEIHGERLHHR
jgi:hypothetical protein